MIFKHSKQINHQIEVVADMNDLRKLVSEYGKIGSNLNQIAKHFNSGGSQSRAIENEIHQCITDLFLLRKEVLKLAGGMNAIVKHIKSRNTNYSVDIDNMYEFASSHCTDFKDLRDDEDIVINREWILNKLTEEEN